MSNNINQINSNLYYIKSTFQEKTLHFGFEAVNDETFEFWNYYKQTARQVADLGDGLCLSATEDGYPNYPNELSQQFNYSEERYHQVMKFIQKKGFFKTRPIKGVHGGVNGMEQVLERSRTDRKIFMVYLSKVPVEKSHTKKRKEISISNVTDYQAVFGDIVMSLVFINANGTPTVSHFGNFRNPIDFLDTEERYKGVSMKLHGVAAKIALTYFTGKKYMITKPMPSMTQIMRKSLEKDSLHIGTNNDLKSLKKGKKTEEDKELLTEHPPIFHLEKKTLITKIAKKGVDLLQHLDYLPDEKAEFVAQPNEEFNLAGSTLLRSMITLIDLEKLASFGGEIEVISY